MKSLYLLLVLVFVGALSACKNRIYTTVTEPAPVFLEKEFETVGVINRSYSAGAAKVLDVIDNALTLEGNVDQEGSKAAVEGAFSELTQNPRFKKVLMLDSMTVKGGGMDIFPAQLPWDEVQRICDSNEVQILVVLEVFDTDTKISYSTETVNQSTPLGNVPVLRHTATSRTWIKTGWRIYDPKNKWIRDEFWWRDQIVSTGSGINPVKAASTILKRGQAVKQLGTQIGRYYGGRFEDQRFRVWREYFKGGSPEIKMGHRRAQVNNFDGAAEKWLLATKSPKRKVAGKACYNMAVYSEINGDIYGALEWAEKSYTDYRIKDGKDYARLLRERIRKFEQNQMRKDLDE
ncbi:DUF6340 family protein [Paracrocinitomix mangrovi]|uniref:DUF6340 family protein n=1 Tax=Paracrocinitomix mangrovi TaxID=2862509 RepID=UPI001C8E0EE5|nr:DUF6340 family protein [Paracrocinitomix mangrovi]UKN02451.1 DUF6340 family protein [Paracrocinitomix mangrovi]